MVCRFMKGIFNQEPPTAKYDFVWDPDVVISYLDQIGSNDSLTLRNLTIKTTLLIALATQQRVQTICSLSRKDFIVDINWCQFAIIENLKQSKPGRTVKPITLFKYPSNENICVVKTVFAYIERTKEMVKDHEKHLLVTYGKPHKKPSRDTVRRWIVEGLKNAGIDTNVYSAHSTRHASSSKAVPQNHASIKVILQKGGWKTESVFRKHYLLPVCSLESPYISPKENSIKNNFHDYI